MARTVYVTTELVGAGAGLDGIAGGSIVAGDLAFHLNRDTTKLAGHEGNYFGLYMATTDAKTESSPETIVPDSAPGSFNWEHLSPLMSVFHTTGMGSTIPNYGVTIIRTSGPSVHAMKRPRRGVYKKLIFATTSVVKVRLTTAAAADLAAPTVRFDGCGHPAASGSTVCVVAFSSKQVYGVVKIPSQVELVGRSTSRWEIMSMSCPTTAGGRRVFRFSSST